MLRGSLEDQPSLKSSDPPAARDGVWGGQMDVVGYQKDTVRGLSSISAKLQLLFTENNILPSVNGARNLLTRMELSQEGGRLPKSMQGWHRPSMGSCASSPCFVLGTQLGIIYFSSK